MFLVLVICVAVVIAFDVLASFVSKLSRIPYPWFSILSALMYFSMGAMLYRLYGLSESYFAILVFAATCEASIGWWLSALIGPGRPHQTTLPFLLKSAAVAIAFAVTMGTLGGGAALLFSSSNVQ